MKTACYVRVSTEEQTKGHSIDAQKMRLQEYCEKNDIEEYVFYIDEGISAKDTKRPGYQKLMEEIRRKNVDQVLCWKLDRFHRNTKNGLVFFETLEEFKVNFVSLTENIDTNTPSGKLMLSFYLLIAQNEIDNVSQRTKNGLYGSARKGNYPRGVAPFGYNIEDKKLVPCDEQAPVVQFIFRLYTEEEMSKNAILTLLKEQSVMNKKWHYSTIEKLLNNPIYKGTLVIHNEILEDHSIPIISKETFELAQKIQKGWSKKAVHDYVFQGLLVNENMNNFSCTTQLKKTGNQYKYYIDKENKIYIAETKIYKEFYDNYLDGIIKHDLENKLFVYDKNFYLEKIEKLKKRIDRINKLVVDEVLLDHEAKEMKVELYNEINDINTKLHSTGEVTREMIYDTKETISREDLIYLLNKHIRHIRYDSLNKRILSVSTFA